MTRTIGTEDAAAAFKSIRVIFIALLIGMLLFMGVTVYLQESESLDFTDQGLDMYLYIGAGLMVMAIVAQYLMDRSFHVPGPSVTLVEKIASYRKLKIFQWALIEGAVLVNIVFFLLSAKYVYVMMALAGILFFIALRPSLAAFAARFQLNQQEKDTLV